jgi:osmotically-inducible protein OsmY
MLNRTKGAFARMAAAMTCHEEDDDEVVAARVRSHMGHVTQHAHAVESEVKDGIVTLHGILPEDDRQRVIGEVRRIPGVKDVHDRLASQVSV